MDYVLKNKDKEVLYFSTKETPRETTLHDIHVVNETLLPLYIQNRELEEGLCKWIKKRKVPKNREFARNILLTLGEKESLLMGYINVSFGLSLNDSFWVLPEHKKHYKWADYNLYNNEFDLGLQLAALGQKVSYKGKSSPELTTNGMLQKCWHRDNGHVYLYKGSYVKEASAEHYNYQIAKKLNLNAVPYELIRFHNSLLSKCPLFTSEDVGYIPIGNLLPKGMLEDHPDFIDTCMHIYGQETFEDMMIFDSLIGNIDRHTGNFGVLVDNNTNKILGPAPIFDNGLGMLGCHNPDRTFEDEFRLAVSAFGKYFDEEFSRFFQPRHEEWLEILQDFTLTRHELANIPEETLQEFEENLQERIEAHIENNCSPSMRL